jgi:hypothetical protein
VHDTITDFHAGDRLDVSAFHVADTAALQALITASQNDTITFATGDSVTLTGVPVHNLPTNDFILHH